MSRTVTVGIINFNGRNVLPDTLAALRALGRDGLHLVLVDNGSTDGSPEWVEEHYPEVAVNVVADDGNPCRARNWVLRNAPDRHVLLLDNDIVVEDGCIERLLETMEEDPSVLACTPRIVYKERPEVIHNDVGRFHYLGVSGHSDRGRTTDEVPPGPPQATIPGGIALVDRELAREVGLFDEAYVFGWGDDAHLYIRGIVMGYRCVHVSRARMRHPVPAHGTRRAFAQIHNRYRLLLTVYRGRSLLLLGPALLAFEIALTGAFLLSGLTGTQLRAIRETFRQRQAILEERRHIQASREVPDRAWLEGRGFSGGDPLQEPGLARLALRAADAVFRVYWQVAGRWV